MKKITIEDAANFFGISKEAIYNRIRRGTLQTVVEGGIKYVLLDPTAKKRQTSLPKNLNPYAEKLQSVLEEQNKELRAKIEKLENEIRQLQEEKERLLIEEKMRIEQIYKEKDEQLKSILSMINTRFMLEAKPLEDEHFEAEIEEQQEHKPLKKYLKEVNIGKKKRKKIYTKAKELSKKENRFFFKKKKLYIDPSRYDYEDIF